MSAASSAGDVCSYGVGHGRAVAPEPVGDVPVLLEVAAQRHVDERSAVRDQLHRRRQPALHDCQVAAGQRAEEIVDVADGAHPLDRLDQARVDPRPAHEQQLRLGHVAAQLREAGRDPPQERDAHAGAADRADDQRRPGSKPSSRRRRSRVGEVGRIERQHVAGEVEVALAPSRGSNGSPGPKLSGTTSSGSPTKTAASRTRG